MAKGQMRSNREAKKPKKAVAEKPKAGSASVFAPPSRNNNSKPGSKKG